MHFHIITIFPEAFESYFASSLLKRAQKKGVIKIHFYNPRDFAKDKHKMVDDKPFGGGPGMVMKAEPIMKAINTALRKIKSKSSRNKTVGIVLLSPWGRLFTQKIAMDFSKRFEHVIFILGRYEGVDERIKKMLHASGLKAQELSIGPYILSGGELAAMVIVEVISRHIPGVLGKYESLEEIHGSYPLYTRPEILKYKNKEYKAPKILLSGNHKKIAEWRREHKR